MPAAFFALRGRAAERGAASPRAPAPGAAPRMRRALQDGAREGWHRWADMRSIFNVAGGNGQECGLQSRRIERTAPVVRNAVSKTPGQGVAREARSKNASHRRPQTVRFKPMGGKIDRISRDLSHCRELVGDRGRAEPSGYGASAGEGSRRLRRQHPRALCGAGARAVRGRAIGSPSQMHCHRSSPPRFMASSAGQLASRRSWASGGGAPWQAGTTCMPAARGATVRLRLGALVASGSENRPRRASRCPRQRASVCLVLMKRTARRTSARHR